MTAPRLTTDRSSYSPSSPIAHIVGSGFASKANLLLRVRVPDGAVETPIAITADARGAFAYYYTTSELGSYRIEVLKNVQLAAPLRSGVNQMSAPDQVIAATTFSNSSLANTQIWSSGFETGSAVDGVEWTKFGGNTTPTIQSAMVHSGSWALHTKPATANSSSWAKKDWLSANGDADIYIRFYLYIAAVPSGATRILSIQTLSDTGRAGIRLTPGGTLQLWREGSSPTQVGSDSTTIPLNTWTSVELHYDGATASGSSFSMEASVDGTAFASGSVSTTATQVARLQTGLNNAAGIGSPDLYFDDVSIDDVNAGLMTGHYWLASRSLHTGATITTGPIGYSATTATDGTFSLVVPAGTYTITASMAGYLPTQKSNVSVSGSGTIALSDAIAVPGDLDSSGAIDVLDLALVGGAFGSQRNEPLYDARADVNDDGNINILDLVLTGANYEKQGAQPWP